jgi:hypothetical protein
MSFSMLMQGLEQCVYRGSIHFSNLPVGEAAQASGLADKIGVVTSICFGCCSGDLIRIPDSLHSLVCHDSAAKHGDVCHVDVELLLPKTLWLMMIKLFGWSTYLRQPTSLRQLGWSSWRFISILVPWRGQRLATVTSGPRAHLRSWALISIVGAS